jgi:hypothetical protein
MSKNLNIHAQKVTEEIYDILGVRPSGAQGDKIAQAIEQVIVKALNKSVERSTDAAMEICAFDSTMADKVAENIRGAHTALIANLSALR